MTSIVTVYLALQTKAAASNVQMKVARLPIKLYMLKWATRACSIQKEHLPRSTDVGISCITADGK